MQKIFDSHLHLWDLQRLNLTWLESMPSLKRNFCLKDLQDAYEGFEFLGGLYVETNCDDKEAEARFAFELQKQGLKLCLGSLEQGISSFRQVLHADEKGAKRLQLREFKELLKELEKRKLPFEACVKSEDLSLLEQSLRDNKELKIVLNHFASPKISTFNSYKKDLKNLSQYENLWIKLSAPDVFDIQFAKEVFAFLKENFSEHKLLFGSNFPVANLSPKQWVECILQSEVFENLDGIFYQNALTFYKGG